MIESGKQVKTMILVGWELWHIDNRQYPGLPGHWELRKRSSIERVSWDAIVKLRQGLKWFDDNTTEVQVGRDWVYRPKQASLNMIFHTGNPNPFAVGVADRRYRIKEDHHD